MDSASRLPHGACWQASIPHKVLAGSFHSSPREPLCKCPCDKAASSPRASDPGVWGHTLVGIRSFYNLVSAVKKCCFCQMPWLHRPTVTEWEGIIHHRWTVGRQAQRSQVPYPQETRTWGTSFGSEKPFNKSFWNKGSGERTRRGQG